MGFKGWFDTPGRPGDRTLDQQLQGLGPLLAEVKGKEVLDIGCAEGLIAIELAKAGAKSVLGVEIVESHVTIARNLAEALPCRFVCQDANGYTPLRRYDIVVLLALLHKLWNPTEGCKRFAAAAKDLVVIRIPPGHGRTIVDERSNFVVHDIAATMANSGFILECETAGPFNELTLYYRREY